MSFYTVVATKKNAVGLVKLFRANCLSARFEKIPVEWRIETNRRYLLFVSNPGQADAKFFDRCEKIISEYN